MQVFENNRLYNKETHLSKLKEGAYMQSIELDISMGRKYLLNYEYLDEMKKNINGTDYRLYFVLLGDKYIIKEVSSMGNVLSVFGMNEFSKETFLVQMDMLESFRANDSGCLNIDIINLGSILHITYTKEGVEFLKKNFPNEYEIYTHRINDCGEFWIEIHIDNILGLFFANNGIEYIRKFKVLYIGQSKQENIFDRLDRHKTIQRIHREVGRKYSDKEIYIWLSDVECKVLDKQDVKQYNTEFWFSNSLGKQFQIFDTIQREEAIDIAEALLISHFKPEYNINLKEVKLNIKTYSKFNDVDITAVYYSLDLYWEVMKEKTVLFTDEICTKTKARVITCKYKDDMVESSYDDLDDRFY